MRKINEKKLTTIFWGIEKATGENKSLNFAIEEVSKSVGLKKESVKSYYYKMLRYLRQNPDYARKLNIDLGNYKNVTFTTFDEEEKRNLVQKIDDNLKLGISVRKTCMMLANNDANKTLRLQNKYRSIKGKDLHEVSVEKKEESFRNIINIASAKRSFNKKITDSEINALFLGLLKIVKKSALENANEELKKECEDASLNFRQTIIELNEKEKELKRIKELNDGLNLKIESQQQQICMLLKKLSNRKIGVLEKKSNEKYLRLKKLSEKNKTNNIL